MDLIIDDIKEALERERIAEQAVGWGIICHPSAAIQRMLLLGLLLPVAQQAAGIDAIQYYMLDVMEAAGVASERHQKLFLIGLGVVKLTFIVIGSQLLDRQGRRFVLFLSLSGTYNVANEVDACFRRICLSTYSFQCNRTHCRTDNNQHIILHRHPGKFNRGSHGFVSVPCILRNWARSCWVVVAK